MDGQEEGGANRDSALAGCVFTRFKEKRLNCLDVDGWSLLAGLVTEARFV